MIYVKHPEHGNKHVSAEEAAKLVQAGWAIWPRTKEQKQNTKLTQEPEPIKRSPGRPKSNKT